MTTTISSRLKKLPPLLIQNKITKGTACEISTTQTSSTPRASNPGTHTPALHDCFTETTYNAPEMWEIPKIAKARTHQSRRAEYKILSIPTSGRGCQNRARSQVPPNQQIHGNTHRAPADQKLDASSPTGTITTLIQKKRRAGLRIRTTARKPQSRRRQARTTEMARWHWHRRPRTPKKN
jgi:hypothetical protein